MSELDGQGGIQKRMEPVIVYLVIIYKLRQGKWPNMAYDLPEPELQPHNAAACFYSAFVYP